LEEKEKLYNSYKWKRRQEEESLKKPKMEKGELDSPE
jgi:hypothetical protein